MESSAELNDIQLLERLFLKLVFIKTDDDLEKFIGQYLSPILLKFKSPDEQVQNKLMELLTHLKKRLTNRPNIILPVHKLLERLQQEDNSPRVINFLLFFIRIGLPRCSQAEKAELFPIIDDSLRGKQSTVQKNILQLLIPILPFVKSRRSSDSQLTFDWNSIKEIKPLVLEYLYYYLILPYNLEKFGESIPPGYSKKGFEAIKTNNNNLPTEDALEELKLSIIELLNTEHFKLIKESFVLLVVASGDSRMRVKEKAENILNKIPMPQYAGSLDIAKRLYSLFLGGPMHSVYSRPISAKIVKLLPKYELASPVDITVRVKILPFLVKSAVAQDLFPECVQIVFEALFGKATNNKLMKYSLEFAFQVSENSSDKNIGIIAPLLENALEKFLTQPNNAELKKSGYKAMGHLANRRPEAFREKLQFFQSMFESLMVADKDLGLPIYQCISLMTDAFKCDNVQAQKTLETQFPIFLEEENPLVRLATINCCHRIFCPTHVLSRYLMLIGAGDAREDVRDEAIRGLSLEGKNVDELPDFNQLVSLLADKCNGQVSSTKCDSKLPFKSITFVKMLEYLEQLIFKLSGADSELIPLKQMQRKNEFFLDKYKNKDIILHYLNLVKYGLKPNVESSLSEVSLRSLKCILECIPEFVHEIPNESLEPFIHSSDPNTRLLAVGIVGLIMREKPSQQISEVLQSLLDNDDDKSLLALGHIIGYIRCDNLALIESEYVNKSLNAITSTTINSEHIPQFACESLSIILAHHQRINLDVEELFESVSKMVNSSKADIACKESGFQLLGILAVCCRSEDFLKRVCDCLVKQHNIQGSHLEDTYLVIAESLSLCVVGNRSKAFEMLPFLHISVQYEQTPNTLDDTILKYILDSLFKTLITDQRVLKNSYAISMWLLSLIQLVIVPFNLYDELEQIHTALLLILLKTSIAMSQEAASIGLYVTFETSSEDIRQKLLGSLQKYMMSTYTRTKQSKESKEMTLELALSKTTNTTYKEIFYLASRVLKDPTLTYSLINLGHVFNITTIRRSQTLALHDIKDESITRLKPYLSKLIPKIYYFHHDPNQDLQKLMNYIWQTLTKDDNNVIEHHFAGIMTEIKSLLGHKLSTYRQGSCLCLRDLFTSQSSRSFAEHLTDLWRLLLKNVDDERESVRSVASMATDTLARITIKICDSYQTDLAEKHLELILPLILEYAVDPTKNKTVQSFCLCITRVITNRVGKLAKPYILDILPALLIALSDLECQALGEVSVKADADQISQEKIESFRLQLNNCSPLMKTIKTCIKYVDADVLEKLVPRLIDLIRNSIGLNTMFGCGKVAGYLAAHFNRELAPYSHKLINAFMSKMNHKSLSIKKTFSSSISQLTKIANEETFEKLINKIKDFYLNEDTDQQLNACLLLQALNNDCNDLTSKFKSNLLPTVYFAVHDKVVNKEDAQSDDDAKLVNNAQWEEIWNSLAPYKEKNLVPYLDEVMEILQQNLVSQVWARREQSLKALIDLVDNIPEKLSIKQINSTLAILMKHLPGRIWDGKVHIPRAIELLAVSCSEKIKAGDLPNTSTSIQSVISTLLEEAGRSGSLQQGLIQAVGSIISEYKSEKYPEFFKLAYSLLYKQSKTNEEAKKQNEMTKVIFSAFAKVFPNSVQVENLPNFFTSAAQQINKSQWKVKLAVLESLGNVCDKIATKDNPELVTEFIGLVLKPVIISTGNQMYSAIRGESLKVLLKLLDLLERCKSIGKVLTNELKALQAQQANVIASNEHRALLGRVMSHFDVVLK